MQNMISGEVKQIGKAEFWALFSPTAQDALAEKAAQEGVSGFVCYECLQMDSTHHGKRAAIAFGPSCSARSEGEALEVFPRLGSLPSNFQYPVSYCFV